jgi:hypothetical protein
MKKSLFVFALAMVLSSIRVHASEQEAVATLQISCASCQLGGQVHLQAGIENRSDEPLMVYSWLGWGELGGFVLHVKDDKGNDVSPTAMDDDMIIPSTLEDIHYYSTLFKRHGLSVRRSASVKELFQRPGNYVVWVTYRSPVPAKLALKADRFLSREDGSLVSEKLHVIVK